MDASQASMLKSAVTSGQASGYLFFSHLTIYDAFSSTSWLYSFNWKQCFIAKSWHVLLFYSLGNRLLIYLSVNLPCFKGYRIGPWNLLPELLGTSQRSLQDGPTIVFIYAHEFVMDKMLWLHLNGLMLPLIHFVDNIVRRCRYELCCKIFELEEVRLSY